jgi:hypothetical protein
MESEATSSTIIGSSVMSRPVCTVSRRGDSVNGSNAEQAGGETVVLAGDTARLPLAAVNPCVGPPIASAAAVDVCGDDRRLRCPTRRHQQHPLRRLRRRCVGGQQRTGEEVVHRPHPVYANIDVHGDPHPHTGGTWTDCGKLRQHSRDPGS